MKVTVGNTIFDIDSHQEIKKLVGGRSWGFAFGSPPPLWRPLVRIGLFERFKDPDIPENLPSFVTVHDGVARGRDGSPPRVQS
jgi:hypothetical protein